MATQTPAAERPCQAEPTQTEAAAQAAVVAHAEAEAAERGCQMADQEGRSEPEATAWEADQMAAAPTLAAERACSPAPSAMPPAAEEQVGQVRQAQTLPAQEAWTADPPTPLVAALPRQACMAAVAKELGCQTADRAGSVGKEAMPPVRAPADEAIRAAQPSRVALTATPQPQPAHRAAATAVGSPPRHSLRMEPSGYPLTPEQHTSPSRQASSSRHPR